MSRHCAQWPRSIWIRIRVSSDARQSSPELLRRAPARIGIISGHLAGQALRLRSEVLLKDNSILVDDEGHDSRVSIAGGIGDECESLGHAAADQVALGTARRIRSLGGQDSKVIAVKRIRSTRRAAV